MISCASTPLPRRRRRSVVGWHLAVSFIQRIPVHRWIVEGPICREVNYHLTELADKRPKVWPAGAQVVEFIVRRYEFGKYSSPYLRVGLSLKQQPPFAFFELRVRLWSITPRVVTVTKSQGVSAKQVIVGVCTTAQRADHRQCLVPLAIFSDGVMHELVDDVAQDPVSSHVLRLTPDSVTHCPKGAVHLDDFPEGHKD